MNQNQPESSWHFDKTVNISLIIAISAATASGIWFAAISSARLDMLEKQMAVYAPMVERIIRLEGKVDSIHSGLQDIKTLLRLPLPERK